MSTNKQKNGSSYCYNMYSEGVKNINQTKRRFILSI